MSLARIIHIFEDNKSLLCYKHVDKTMFVVPRNFSQACSGPVRSARGEFRRRSSAAEGRRLALWIGGWAGLLPARRAAGRQGRSFVTRVGGATRVLARLRLPGRQRLGSPVRGSDSQTASGPRSDRGSRPGFAADAIPFRERGWGKGTLSFGRVSGRKRDPAPRQAASPSRLSRHHRFGSYRRSHARRATIVVLQRTL